MAKIRRYNGFSIQHIDDKFSTFIEKKKKKLEKLPFFSATHKITYIAGYLSSTHDEYWARYDFNGHCHNVLNNNQQLFTSVEVASGGYLPSREANIFGREFRANFLEVNSKGYPEFE